MHHDYDLLSQIKADLPAGRQDSLEVLLVKYEKRIYTTAYRYFNNAADAADAAQESALKICRNIMGVTILADNPDGLAPWISTITIRTCLDVLRYRKRRPEQLYDHEDPAQEAAFNMPMAPSAENIALHRDRNATIASCIACLPDESKAIIIMRDMQGLSYQELSEAMGIPVNTIKSRLHRARAHLRKLLTEQGVTP